MWPIRERENRHSWSYCGQILSSLTICKKWGVTVLLCTSNPLALPRTSYIVIPFDKTITRQNTLNNTFLIHSANPKSRPVEIIVFTHVVRPSPLFKSRKTKQKTMNVRYWRDIWVWPSESLLTPDLFREKNNWISWKYVERIFLYCKSYFLLWPSWEILCF